MTRIVFLFTEHNTNPSSLLKDTFLSLGNQGVDPNLKTQKSLPSTHCTVPKALEPRDQFSKFNSGKVGLGLRSQCWHLLPTGHRDDVRKGAIICSSSWSQQHHTVDISQADPIYMWDRTGCSKTGDSQARQ